MIISDYLASLKPRNWIGPYFNGSSVFVERTIIIMQSYIQPPIIYATKPYVLCVRESFAVIVYSKNGYR